ncbi:hypothetical protein [Stieleria marina]|uniref:hypothetical protein n=1 Tax=Stieleria marina TaxID=1930275 RepID=UPI003AF403FB
MAADEILDDPSSELGLQNSPGLQSTPKPHPELDRLLDELQQPSRQLRIKFFLTGVVFPVSCFVSSWMGLNASVDTAWQSGRLEHFLPLVLSWPCFAPVLPLVGFSMAALTASVVRPLSANRRWIRMGLYGGVVMAVSFLIAVIFASAVFTVIAAASVAPILALIVYCIFKSGQWAKRFTIMHLLVLTSVVAIVIAACASMELLTGWGDLQDIPLGIGFWIVAASPTLTCLTYIRASVTAARIADAKSDRSMSFRSGTGIMIVVAWLLAWIASWKLAVDLMLIEYAKLPTAQPNCYVSSAAAYGHRKWVGSQQSPSGLVNQQMRELKFIEFALVAAAPGAHSILRRAYNFGGPKLASVCRSNVWFADLTFLALKPLEFMAKTLRQVCGISRFKIDQLYR